MPRIALLADDELKAIGASNGLPDPGSYMGFIPNSMRILGHKPEVFKAFGGLAFAIMGPGSSISAELRNLVAQMASKAAGCRYCQAHTAHSSLSVGVSTEKEEALWSYEDSPLFNAAERAALRVANLAALVPNMVSDEDFEALREHFSTTEIVDIVSVIAFFGFLNRFNDTMATPLEGEPGAAALKFLAPQGWTPGKHG
jgi:uncharacterized peroxidase-related enzyme